MVYKYSMRFFEKLDLSHAGKVFVVGDIHGMFTLLDKTLEEVGFDYATDHLVSVGDLVDRGPESDKAIEYVAQPWFHFVRGNHEQLVMANLHGNAGVHRNNGGAWFNELSDKERKRHCDILNDAPVVLEVTVPSGRRIGIVHADFPTNDWNAIYDLPEAYQRQWGEYCLWERIRAYAKSPGRIRNIDHVYFGHTPLPQVRNVQNCSWIDTGACRSGVLSVIEVL